MATKALSDGDTVTLLVTGIFQDEPTNTVGDGNTSSDASGIGTSTPAVRAERSGTPRVPGDGRVYHIYFSGSDGLGGSCSGEVTVGVPHDQGQRSIPLDDDGPVLQLGDRRAWCAVNRPRVTSRCGKNPQGMPMAPLRMDGPGSNVELRVGIDTRRSAS